MGVTLHLGDCLDVMTGMEPDSIDAIVTDPPYGLAFMGKDWDHGVPGIPFWEQALRVVKPGAHLLAFGGTRTYHRLAVAIEDAGWEIRDTIMWVYGSGFPKSHNVSKAIDKAAGAEREVVGVNGNGRPNRAGKHSNALAQAQTVGGIVTQPATPAAAQWDGWGTALKPAWEPIIVARKPFRGTVAANVLEWGTGAINVDGCRVEGITRDPRKADGSLGGNTFHGQAFDGRPKEWNNTQGRWPANLIHDGSDEVVGLFPESSTTGNRSNGSKAARVNGTAWGVDNHESTEYPNDSGSAARFFYCAKASRADRDEGLDGMPKRGRNEVYGNGLNTATKCDPAIGHTPDSVAARPQVRNHHPTVKPTELMRYLCRLITPPGGVVLDPFMGSGSTGKGAVLEGFGFVGIEQDAEYLEIARRRIEAVRLPLFAGVVR